MKDFRYVNKVVPSDLPISTIDSDWFTEQDIDCTLDELTKNNTSKSIILAPFNSTLTDCGEVHSSRKASAAGAPVIEKRSAIKLGAKVREVDRQYEKNNNCEVDNGVYNKEESGKGEELNPLASNEESLQDEAPEADPSHRQPEKRNVLSPSSVQAHLLNSLAPQPLNIGITIG